MKSTLALSKKEKRLCEQLSLTDLTPHNRRAQALILVVDQGLTHSKAGELTGLTVGQVRYCLHRFRTLRMKMFPSQLKVHPETTVSQSSSTDIDVSAPDSTAAQKTPKKVKTSTKKTNKTNKKDKAKKGKNRPKKDKSQKSEKKNNKPKKKDKSKKKKDKTKKNKSKKNKSKKSKK